MNKQNTQEDKAEKLRQHLTFRTTVYPAAIAVAMPLVANISAAFQGGMHKTGPTGSLKTKLIVPGLSFCGIDPVPASPETCAAISSR